MGGQVGQVVSGWSVGGERQRRRESVQNHCVLSIKVEKTRVAPRQEARPVQNHAVLPCCEGESQEDDLEASELKYLTVRMRIFIYIYIYICSLATGIQAH